MLRVTAPRALRRLGLGCASLALSALCGCSWNDLFPPRLATVSNSEAVDRALQLCSLAASDRPFHLRLDIAPPSGSSAASTHAQIEVYWLNAIAYRTEIRSPGFEQTRIVNGQVVEERNSGDFYPRWIENFADALLDPVPDSAELRKIPGSIPIGVQSHACITGASSEVCFQDAEPRIASGCNPSRCVWFGDFAPFGRQQIPRTLVDQLPGNLLVHAHIDLLVPLAPAEYPLTKAKEFTLPAKLIVTEPVPSSTAESWMEGSSPDSGKKPQSESMEAKAPDSPPAEPALGRQDSSEAIYIRTDRAGRVREAYPDNSDPSASPQDLASRALALRFKPLVVGGVPRQMEATVAIPQ